MKQFRKNQPDHAYLLSNMLHAKQNPWMSLQAFSAKDGERGSASRAWAAGQVPSDYSGSSFCLRVLV